MDEALRLVLELEKLETQLDLLDTPLAFANKGPEAQAAWIRATDYSDEWTCEYTPDGSVLNAMRVY